MTEPQKVKVNLVYSPQTGKPHKVFENEKGEVWRSKKYDNNMKNVGMGWYSIRDPRPGDSILVVEPICVLQKDYNPAFLKRFKHVFTWAVPALEKTPIKNRLVKINHPTYNSIPSFEALKQNWLPWEERKDEIVIIANNKSSQHHSELYSLRIQLADMLHAASKMKVSWYGQIPLKKAYYVGTIPDKNKILREVKFSLCTENSYDETYTQNYFSEKMPDVWIAGAMPLYMGCYNVDEFGFFDHSYIDLRNYTKKANKSWAVHKRPLLERIHGFDKGRYQNYVSGLRVLFNTNKLKPFLYDNLYETMIDTLSRDK